MSGPVFLLDTNILSSAGLQCPSDVLRSWMKTVGADSLAISFPIIAELRRGAHLASKDDPEKADRLHCWIDDILLVDFQFAELTSRAADLYAKMTSVGPLRHLYMPNPQQKSGKIGHDLLFAALSIAHKMPIATFNIKDFVLINRYLPLPGVLHPVEGKWYVPFEANALANYELRQPSVNEFEEAGGFSFMR